MPQQPVRDLMQRTMHNLAHFEAEAGPRGPFEVTQFVNSFLGAMVHPWEKLKAGLGRIPVSQAIAHGWPDLATEEADDQDPCDLGDLVRPVRNGLAHGNIEFVPDANSEIGAIRVWNIDPRTGRCTWGTVVTVAAMRCFLSRFVELAEQMHVSNPS
jgi:hypothetical protein